MTSDLVPLTEFGRDLRVSRTTLDRWRHAGICGLTLVPVRVGGRLYYSRAAYREWQAGVDAEKQRRRLARKGAPRPARTTRARRRTHDAAMAALERMGVF